MNDYVQQVDNLVETINTLTEEYEALHSEIYPNHKYVEEVYEQAKEDGRLQKLNSLHREREALREQHRGLTVQHGFDALGGVKITKKAFIEKVKKCKGVTSANSYKIMRYNPTTKTTAYYYFNKGEECKETSTHLVIKNNYSVVTYEKQA